MRNFIMFSALVSCLALHGHAALADKELVSAGQPPGVAAGWQRYQVTIKNLMKGQPVAPPVIVTHGGSVEPFKVGEPASRGVQLMAEEGDTAIVANELLAKPETRYVFRASQPVPPGMSRSWYVWVKPGFERISIGAMLGTTNDGFTWGTFSTGSSTLSMVYDAGTERNSELCEWIPGPPCERHRKHDPAPAEGSVQPHPGFQGVGDLNPAKFGWTPPIAEVNVIAAP